MKVQLIDSVKNAIDYIISNENYKTFPEIEVAQGSENGDGYASKTQAVSINDKNGKIIELFVKYLPEGISEEMTMFFNQAFQTEFRFYHEIYPAFKRFQDKKGINEPFNNVPKHYRTNVKSCGTPPIILENLRSLGYTLRNRKKPVDDNHLRLPIIAFARYHAISYAIKDQEPELFEQLCTGATDILAKNFKEFRMDEMTTRSVNQLLESLNTTSDARILNYCKNLSEVLIEHTVSIPQYADQYAVINQGDCWSNNMMFLYDDKTGVPIDVKLIDWQCQRVNSPLLDFAYFFYTLATKEVLDNADYYLNLYYDTLSHRIKELGSDPEKMFPREVFLAHWKKFSLFGLTMAFCVIKVQLFEDDEIPDMMADFVEAVDAFSMVLKHQDKFISRTKDLVEHFIDKGLL